MEVADEEPRGNNGEMNGEGGAGGREQWVETQMQNTIVENSKGTYLSKITGFLNYLDKHAPNMLHHDFKEKAVRDTDGLVAKKFIKGRLFDTYPPLPTIDHSKFETNTVHLWLSTLKGRASDQASASSYNTARSAIRQLFVRYNVKLPEDYEQKTSTLMGGLKRTIAQSKQKGELKVR